MDVLQVQLKGHVPLDVANVMQQKSSLLQLRTQLTDKRPIIDSSLLACHNLLRRLAIKRAQDVQQARLPPSASMASSIAGSVAGSESAYDPLRVHQIRAAKRQELANLEATISREMQRLLEVWNSLQVNVEMRLQRLDDAHLVSVPYYFYHQLYYPFSPTTFSSCYCPRTHIKLRQHKHSLYHSLCTLLTSNS